ncbi:MAG: four helix bundle protein, partial [Bacteroidales bacterium]
GGRRTADGRRGPELTGRTLNSLNMNEIGKEFKFERLVVWRESLDYLDSVYRLIKQLPKDEEFNLKSQLRRAATSICLNIAEGSIATTNAEQVQFLKIAIRSLVETVACLKIIQRNDYITDNHYLTKCDQIANRLFARLQSFKSSLLS